MTTTSSPTAAQTAVCDVCYGSDYVEVRSRATGKAVRIDVSARPEGWGFFSAEEKGFLDGIATAGDPLDSETVLTFAAMRRFRDLAERLASAPAAAEPAPEPAPAADCPACPVCPVCNATMVRMASDRGWRCSRAGRWLPRDRRWTGCRGCRWDDTAVRPLPAAPAPARPALAPAAQAVADRTVLATAARAEQRTLGRGVDAAEIRINQLQQTCRTLEGEISMLIYDIPSNLDQECPNPSNMLWPYGFRLNKSCWVLPEKGLNAAAVQQLLAHWSHYPAVEVHVIPYAEHAKAQIRRIAGEKLREEIIRAHTSLINRLASASQRLADARAELDAAAERGEQISAEQYDTAERRRESDIRSILKKAGESLAASISCAEMFDETENVQDLLAGLRAAVSSELASFNAQMLAKGGKPADVAGF